MVNRESSQGHKNPQAAVQVGADEISQLPDEAFVALMLARYEAEGEPRDAAAEARSLRRLTGSTPKL